MSSVKYVYNRGLAFSEEKDLKRLSDYAQEGWLLEGFAAGGLFYKLRRGKPQSIEYSLDYRTNPDEDYFSFFEASGWELVCSAGNRLHIFRAPTGTKPIYTDNDTLTEKYEHEAKFSGKYALYTLLVNIICWSFVTWKPFHLPSIPYYLFLFLGILALIAFVFTFLPYTAYLRKRNHLQKLKNGQR